MKRQSHYITAPITLWENEQLTWLEKTAMIEIDSMTSDVNGVAMSASRLASLLHITKSEAKSVLNSLYLKSAIVLTMDEDGVIYVKAQMFKEDYSKEDKKEILEDKPKPRLLIDFDLIQEQWATINPNLPSILRFTPQRKRRLRTTLHEADMTVDDLIKVFHVVSQSKFLNGDNGRQWTCTFDWLIKSASNLTKVYEGKYNHSFAEQSSYQDIMDGNLPGEESTNEVYQ